MEDATMHLSALVRPARSLPVGFVVLASVLIGTTGAARAATPLNLTVNSTADTHAVNPGSGKCADAHGHCTLRAATEVANAQTAGRPITIKVPVGTVKLPLGVLSLKHNAVVVTGAGATTTVVTAQGASRVLTVAAAAKVTLDHLELTGGTAPSGISSQNGGNGGGIMNSGSLYLTNSTISANVAGSGGYGGSDTAGNGGNGGGIANSGTLTIASSTISGNSAGTGGIGQPNNELSGSGGNGGGLYSSGGSAPISRSG